MLPRVRWSWSSRAGAPCGPAVMFQTGGKGLPATEACRTSPMLTQMPSGLSVALCEATTACQLMSVWMLTEIWPRAVTVQLRLGRTPQQTHRFGRQDSLRLLQYNFLQLAV